MEPVKLMDGLVVLEDIMSEEAAMDLFSLEDRRELIKQSLTLDRIVSELKELKEKMVEDHDIRIQSLEDDRIRSSTQIKTILWFGGFLVTLVQIAVEVTVHIILK